MVGAVVEYVVVVVGCKSVVVDGEYDIGGGVVSGFELVGLLVAGTFVVVVVVGVPF